MIFALAAPELPDDPGDGSWGEILPAPVLTASSSTLLAMSASTLSF